MAEDARPTAVYVDTGAPALVFDGVSAMWQTGGLFSLILANGRPTPMTDNTVPIVPHVVAQLQTNRAGLLALKKAIEDLLLASAEPHGKAQ